MRVRQLTRRPAGKAINVARILSSFHVPTLVAGFVGAAQARTFERSLGRTNSTCQLLAVPGGRTRENVTIADPINRIETHLQDRGFSVDADLISRMNKKLSLLLHPGQIVCICGSLPTGMADEEFVHMVRQTIEAGCCVVIDTSGSALHAVANERLFAIKPNRQELGDLLDKTVRDDQELISAGTQLAQKMDNVLISCGQDGGYLCTRQGIHHGHTRLAQQHVRSTVGCGDALLAGFLAGVTQGRSSVEAFQLALATATAAALTYKPGHANRRYIDRLIARTEVATSEMAC